MHLNRKWLYFSFAIGVLCMLAPLAGAQNVNCSSEDGHRKYCPVDTRGGVQMTNQRSGSPCIQGQTWGYDRGGIWVDRGCRADFVVGNNGYQRGGYGRDGYGSGGGSQMVNCSSEDGGRHFCPISPNSRVTLAKQRSGSACIEGRTWGYNNNQIWVDRGCRADFNVEARGGYGRGRDRDHDRDRDRDHDRDYRGGGSQADQFINCSSEDGHRKYCPVDTSRARVQMTKQRSGSPCVQGQTWGYDRGGIWVDRGCRADFQVVR